MSTWHPSSVRVRVNLLAPAVVPMVLDPIQVEAVISAQAILAIVDQVPFARAEEEHRELMRRAVSDAIRRQVEQLAWSMANDIAILMVPR